MRRITMAGPATFDKHVMVVSHDPNSNAFRLREQRHFENAYEEEMVSEFEFEHVSMAVIETWLSNKINALKSLGWEVKSDIKGVAALSEDS